jgi:hypothetical protein
VIASFLTWLGDAAMLATFAVAVLLSLMIATWWGELAGIRPHRDKSGLGGFAAIYLLLAMRWLLLAPLVFVGASPFVAWPWILLGHTLLGVLGLLGLHAWGFWQRRRERFRPDPAPAPSEVVDTDRGGR